MTPSAPLRPANLADHLLAVDVFSELLASTEPRQVARRLTEQLRELTGARTIMLLAHPESGAPHALLHVCPERRSGLFTIEELSLFCPNCDPGPLPHRTETLPSNHPLRPLLQRAGVETLLRFPLRVRGELVASLVLLDLPQPDRVEESETIVSHLSPVIALALKNAFSQERIAQQTQALQAHADDLERRVAERTAALEAANKSYASSRLAALNLMEDAVAARRGLENANDSLQREIAERNRAEEALRQTQQRLELAQRAAGAGAWDWDMTTGRIQWSSELFTIFGLDPARDQASLENWQRVIHPDDRAGAAQRLEQAIQAGTLLENEYRVVLPDGRIRWILAVGRTTYDANRRPIRMAGICLDTTARKTTEAALQHSEALFRSTFDAAPVGAAIVGLDQTFQRVNAALCSFLGYTAAELQGMLFPKITHPDDVPESIGHVRQLLAGEIPSFDLEKRYLRADGAVVWGRVSVSLVRDGDGRPLHLVPIIQDVTERKQAEEATVAAERFVRSTIDALDVHLCVLDENGVILTTNRAWDRFAAENGGTPDSTGSGANYLLACESAVGPDAAGAAAAAAGIRAVLAGTNDSLAFEYPCDAPDLHRWFTCRVTRFATPGPLRVVVTHENITERERAEFALKESERRYATTLAAVNDGLWEWHVPSGNAYFSPGYYRMLGYPDAAFVANYTNWRALVHPDDIERVESELQQSVGASRAFAIDLRVKTGSGDWRWVSTRGNTIERDADGQALRMAGTLSDITQRKQAEQELEQFFALVPDMVCIASRDGRFQKLNDEWVRVLGYSKAELMAAPYAELVHPDDRETTIRENSRLSSGAATSSFVNRYRAKDGSYRWLEWNATAANAKGILFAAARDITEHRQAEQAVRESELRYRTLANSGPGLVWTSALDKRCNYFNQTWLTFTGRRLEQELGDGWVQGVHPDDLKRCVESYVNAFDRRERFSMDYRLRHHTGEYRWIQDDGSPRYDSQGNFLGYIGHCLDITERRHAAMALREKTALLEAQVNSTIEGILVVNEEGQKVLQNRRMLELWKIPSAVANDPDDQAQVRHVMHKTRNPDQFAAKVTHLYKHPKETSRDEIELTDGTVLDRYSAPVLGEDGHCYGRIWTFRDITDQKQAENALRESEEKFAKVFHAAPVWIAITDLETAQYRDVNEAGLRASGFTRDEVLGHTAVGLGWLTPEDRARMVQTLQAQGRITDFEMASRTKDGRTLHGLINGERVLFGGRPCLLSITIDITERKRTEELIAWEAALMENSADICCVKDLDLRVRAVNSAFLRAARANSAEEVIGKTDAELLHWPGNDANIEGYLADERRAQTLGPGESILREEQSMLPDGSMRLLLTRKFPVFDPGGRLIATASISTDITERKRAEDDRRRSHELLAKLTAQVPGVVYQYRLFPDGRSCFPFSSPGMRDIYEYAPEDVSEDATPVFVRLHPEDAGAVSSAILESARTLAPFHCEFRVVLPRQGLRWRLSDAMPERTEDGGTLWYGIITDITERKRAEDALHESEQHHRLLIQHLHAGVVVHAPDTRILLANEQASFLLGLTIDQMLGKTAIDPAWCFLHEDGSPVPQDEYPVNRVRSLLEPVRNLVLGIHHPSANGPVWVLINGFPDLDGRGQLQQVVVTFVDITQLRRTEESLRESLREKEALLKEVHHRVKNNLQIISSLLRLQAGQVDDLATKTVLHDMQGRIRSMALLHETLYRSGNLAQVDLADYLQSVCTQSLRASTRREPAAAIRLEFDLPPVLLDATQAVPCGLLVNELVSNCLKHAFPGERGGTIQVSLQPVVPAPPSGGTGLQTRGLPSAPPGGGAVPASDSPPPGGAGFTPAKAEQPRRGVACDAYSATARTSGQRGPTGVASDAPTNTAISSPATLRLTVSDDGVGLPPGFDLSKLNSLGLQLVSDLTRQLQGTLKIAAAPGAGASFTVVFAPPRALTTVRHPELEPLPL